MDDAFEWYQPRVPLKYSKENSRPGDLICESSILKQYINNGTEIPKELLFVVDRFNKLVNVKTNEVTEFDDKEYDRIGGVMFKVKSIK